MHPPHLLHTAVGREEDLMLSAVQLDSTDVLENVNMNCKAAVLVICSGVIHLRRQDIVSDK